MNQHLIELKTGGALISRYLSLKDVNVNVDQTWYNPDFATIYNCCCQLVGQFVVVVAVDIIIIIIMIIKYLFTVAADVSASVQNIGIRH